MKAQPATELRRKIAAACLLAAPLTMLAGDALRFGAGAMHAWLVLLKLSFALFAGAALALVHLASRRADRAGLVGGGLTIVGCLAGAGIITASAIDMSIESAALGEAATSALEAAFRADGVGGLVIFYPLPGLAFPAGLLVLSYALFRARVVSPLTMATLALGAVLFPVGRIGGFAAAVIASGLALSVALSLVGLKVINWTADEWEQLPAAREEAATLQSPTPAG